MEKLSQMTGKSNAGFAEAIKAYLVGRRAEQFAFLSNMVRVNSENPPGQVAKLADKLVVMLESMELPVRRQPVDAERAAELGREPYDNLTVELEFGQSPGTGRHIVLAAHADTPPAGAGWTRLPQGAAIDDGRMFGRGVSEGKGDISAYVFAMAALKDCADGLSGRVELQITFDGITGSWLGAHKLLEVAGDRPDFAVVPGATDAVGATATGVLDLDVDVVGRAVPVGVPQGGADAIEATAIILAELYKHRGVLAKRRSEVEGIGAPTLVVTEVAGGDGALYVPDAVRLLVDRRLLPEEDPKVVQSELTNLIGRAVVAVPGVVCKVRRRRLLPAVVPSDKSEILVSALRDAVEQLGEPRPGIYGTAYETLAREFAAAGVPVAMFGTGEAGSVGRMALSTDESLKLDNVRVATEALALALAELLRPAST